MQDKQSPDRGVKRSSPWHQGLIFPHKILPICCYTIYRLPLETTLVILAQSTIYGSKVPVHNRHGPIFRNLVLGPWLQMVSRHTWIITSLSVAPTILYSLVLNVMNDRRTQQDLINAMGSMYAAIFFLGFQYGSTVQPVVSIERTVFYRERAAGMYSALPYAFSQVTDYSELRMDDLFKLVY